MNVAEFLLARIAEDEALVEGIWGGDDPDFFWGPDRIRAECEAKRLIVKLHGNGDAWCDHCSGYNGSPSDSCPTIRALVDVYADHPDLP